MSQQDCVARAPRGRIVPMNTSRAGVIVIAILGIFGLFARAVENAAPLPVTMIARGLALDKDGNVYFGLGCADFSNAYQLDKEKKPHYDINSTQGTIQRLSADRKRRETLATGVRFAIGIAFNRHGDLFWTDQEGDTLTPGNHLDELSVLLPGKRH